MAAIPAPAAAASGGDAFVLALDRLSSTEPPLFLSPSPELAAVARLACSHLYSALLPSLPKPPPLDRLLAGADFDAEQIWCQIDDASRPLLPLLRRHLNRLQRDPPAPPPVSGPAPRAAAPEEAPDDDEDADEDGDGDGDGDDEDDGEDEDEEEEGEGEEDEEGEEDGEGGEANGVEDQFLKMKELEEFLVKDEAKEYGGVEPKTRREKDDDNDDDEDDEEDDEFGSFDDDGSLEADVGESARYEDFFGSTKAKAGDKNGKRKPGSLKKVKFADELPDFEMDDERDEDEDDQDEDEDEEDEDEHEDGEAQDVVLSTHEKELQKTQSKIKQMEKANMEPKSWTMQGEVTAARRPKNSALEVDLDFEHNVRPAPVITEEVTASLEDLIKKRINEDHFDDVQKAPALPSKAPKELKELDENKSKKGLAEIYEEDYAQKAGLVSAPLSSSDEQKKVATSLFKNLCVKLDALSHFHFAPKPIIEDMSIQTNVPALAMEEIAPLAVSDASMLAPEEIFEGKGDIKEDTELTQAERKRRRASKKRRYKAEEAKRSTKRVRVNTDPGHQNGKVI